jgi:hypothetical protein
MKRIKLLLWTPIVLIVGLVIYIAVTQPTALL